MKPNSGLGIVNDMTYDEATRKQVINYLIEGHSIKDAHRAFGVSIRTIYRWHQKYQKTGSLTREPRPERLRKIDPEKLKLYVEQHPDVSLKQIGQAFGCSGVSVCRAIKRFGLSRTPKSRGGAAKMPKD